MAEPEESDDSLDARDADSPETKGSNPPSSQVTMTSHPNYKMVTPRQVLGKKKEAMTYSQPTLAASFSTGMARQASPPFFFET